jgi:predicted transcriptional regulator
MVKLTDGQADLLRKAATRQDGIIDLARRNGRLAAAMSGPLGALRRKGLAVKGSKGTWIITDAGRAAVGGRTNPCSELPAATPEGLGWSDEARTMIGRSSKRGQLLALASGRDGTCMTTMASVTGWQPHSIRAALSGLRKAGLVIACEKQASGPSTYRLVLPHRTHS